MLKLWLLCGLAASAGAQMRTVQVDAAQVTGAIRSLQGVNGPPINPLREAWDVSKQYKDLRIDLVRTHDFFGPTDIDAQWPDPDAIAKAMKADGAKSIFPHWNADPEKEESYNFGPSDRVISAIVNAGAEVYYRVGRSWSADPAPPPDFDKYANLVKHVAMHYNGGWAHGFHYKIRYWEFWNEPNVVAVHIPGFGDTRPFWSGTPEQFYRLYETVARALKAYDPSLRVGAPALAGGFATAPYYEGLIRYAAAHKAPLDFYSWHHYTHASNDPYDLAQLARKVRDMLDANGFPKAENHVTEWNMSLTNDAAHQSSMEHAAFCGAALTYLEDAPLDRSLYYRADPNVIGFFETDGSYRKKAYTYKALGAMLDTRRRLASSGGDTLGFAVLAGRSEDAKTVQVLISNYEIPEVLRKQRAAPGGFGAIPPRTDIHYENNGGYALKVSHLPWGNGAFSVHRYRITKTDNWAESASSGKGGTLEMSNPLPAPGVELIVIRGK